MAKISPSILAGDFARIAQEVRAAKAAGVDWLHLDVMDGHFVPNLTMGPDLVAAVRRETDLFLDVHLMVTNPEEFFAPFAKAGADLLTFHIEIDPNPTARIKMVRDLGRQVGLSLNPETPVETVLPFLDRIDLVLLMSVHPGFAGQKFIPDALTRAEKIKSHIKSHNLPCLLEIDGGINRTNLATVIFAGVDVVVMGAGYFRDPDRAGLVRLVRGE